MIRPATKEDHRDLFDACKNATAAFYPSLKPDVRKISDGLRAAIIDPSQFVWVSIDSDNAFAGALVALTGENLWAQRKHANIVLWVCANPGDGAALLRQFRAWVRERRWIRVAGILPDCEIDARALQLARRMGFQQSGGAYLLLN